MGNNGGKYEIMYGNTGCMEKRYTADFDEAYDFYLLTIGREHDMLLKGFPLSYVRLTNKKTGVNMNWRSKESMEYEGVW